MSGFNTTANERKQRPIPKEGQHLGLCNMIIDLGTQNESFKGQPKQVHKIWLSWELPKQRAVFSEEKGEHPMVIGQEYNFSLGDKATFRKMMDQWIGKPVTTLNSESVAKLLKRPAMIQVSHAMSKDGKFTYANIAMKGLSVFKRPEEVAYPKDTENESILFDMSNFSWDVFNKIPKFLQEKIKVSLEWSAIEAKHSGGQPSGAISAADQFKDDEDF